MKYQGNPCAVCGLCDQKELAHPKIEPFGKGEKGVLVWGEAPGTEEDEHGEPFYGPVGRFFRPYFERYGLDFEKDCVTVNALDCLPPRRSSGDRKPTKKEIKCCWPRKERVLGEFKPKVVFLLGESAIDSFYGCDPDRRFFSDMPLASYRGKVVPDPKTRAWVCHSYHPSYIERGNQDMEHVFDLDFRAFADMVGRTRPTFEKNGFKVEVLSDHDEIVKLLKGILGGSVSFSFDYETSSYRYHEGIHEIYMVSVSFGTRTCSFRLSEALKPLWMKLMESDIPKIAQGIKHEIKATRYLIGCKARNMAYCTMVGKHVLDGSKLVTNLRNQVYMDFGQYDYGLPDSVIGAPVKKKNRLAEISAEKLGEYCGRDSRFTLRLAGKQRRMLEVRNLEKAYRLFHEGSLAFADMERSGIRIDVPLAERMDRDWGDRIKRLKEEVLDSKEAKMFRRETGRDLKYKKNISPKDLQQLLFDILKFKPVKKTKTGHSVDEETLKQYAGDCELLRHELELRKLSKLKGTYLAQFLRHQVDGFIYPSNNLHLARSYRSSADGPSFHNIVKHSEEGVKIRQVVIPREGREIWEPDYKSMEVRILACMSKDPVLTEYVTGGGDIHGDEAEKLFMVRKGELPKDDFEKLRQLTKNQAIFPEFYGSYYRSIAKSIDVPEDFFPNSSHQRRYEKWEDHVQEWESEFWRRFKGVREWQYQKVEEYRRDGYIEDGAWGFRRYGYLDRNKLFNFPIQGPAFHCLLWSMVELWKEGLGFDKDCESLLCGQIHDAMFWDGVPSEFGKVRERVDGIMTDRIRDAHPWIVVPLEVEWKRGRDNWLEMKDVD